MLEQDVQTYITWTHGAQPTWLQFHGPGTLLDRPVRLTASPPTPPWFPILLPPPAHAARYAALTSSVMMIYAVSRVLRNALEQHPLLPCGDLGDPSPCSLQNEPPVHHCLHRQVASITVMLFYIMGGSVFLPVLVADQDITVAGVCGISGGEA